MAGIKGMATRAYIKDVNSLKVAMAIAGHNQSTLAAAIGTSNQYISQLIRGDRVASPVMAKRIADGIGVSVEEYFFIKTGSCGEQKEAGAN